MCNCNKTPCLGAKQYASCIKFEGSVPYFSSLDDEECFNLQETTQDIYDILEQDKENEDLSALGGECITYTLVDGKIYLKNVLLKYEQIICEMQETIAGQAEQLTTQAEQIAALQENICE